MYATDYPDGILNPDQAKAVENVLATVRFSIPTLEADDPWREYFLRFAVEIAELSVLDEPPIANWPPKLALIP